MAYRAGRHFLHIPGPTNVPDRVLRAMDHPTIDHRGPKFAQLAKDAIAAAKPIFKTEQDLIIFPSSGSGAWEAALVNTLSPGDKVLMHETGQFASLWRTMAGKLGLEPVFIPGDWRTGVDPAVIEERLRADTAHEIKAVCCVHNETSTSVTCRIAEVRQAIDAAGHPALFMVDTISSLASIDYRHDEWGVDVTVGGSQKGLMLPPGLAFLAIGEKARKANETASLPRSYWDWIDMLKTNANGFFPYTPASNMLYGLLEACAMLQEEGLDNVFARHDRHAAATRAAARAWGLDIVPTNPAEYSSTLTAIFVPDGHDADRLREIILDTYDLSLGTGLGRVAGRVFRIGHLGDLNDLTLMGALSGVEMGLELAGIPHQKGGMQAAMASILDWHQERAAHAAAA